MEITLYKLIQLLLLALFAVSISDLRRKEGMQPLIDPRLTLALKLSYPIPTLAYAYILIRAKEFLLAVDLAALAFNLLGAWLTMRGKLDLGKAHTWTGYCSTHTSLMTSGIYAWMRHPLYAGIYAFIIGVDTLAIAHGSLAGAGVVVGGSVFIMLMLAVSARRETEFLSGQFGPAFDAYHRQVHPFLPLRKYHE